MQQLWSPKKKNNKSSYAIPKQKKSQEQYNIPQTRMQSRLVNRMVSRICRQCLTSQSFMLMTSFQIIHKFHSRTLRIHRTMLLSLKRCSQLINYSKSTMNAKGVSDLLKLRVRTKLFMFRSLFRKWCSTTKSAHCFCAKTFLKLQ